MREKKDPAGWAQRAGRNVLGYMCRIQDIDEIVTSNSWGTRKTNSVMESAPYVGLHPKITFCPIDALNIKRRQTCSKELTQSLSQKNWIEKTGNINFSM